MGTAYRARNWRVIVGAGQWNLGREIRMGRNRIGIIIAAVVVVLLVLWWLLAANNDEVDANVSPEEAAEAAEEAAEEAAGDD